MKKLLVFIVILFAGLKMSYASSYKIDAIALETKFAAAQELSLNNLEMGFTTQNTLLKEDVSRITAGVLGVFCGGFGIHRFYMGHRDAGIVYLVIGFATGTSVSAIAGLIDGILYLTSTDDEFVGKYLHNDKIIQWL